MHEAIRINTDGTLELIEIGAHHTGSINDAIGSERFDINRCLNAHGIDLFIDDEGLFNSILNVELSVMAQGNGFDGVLFGDGVFLGVDEASGETLGLSPNQLRTVMVEFAKPRAARAYLDVWASPLLTH